MARQGGFRFRSGQLLRLLPPGRRQRLSFARIARLIQRLDGPAVALLIRMVVTLDHRQDKWASYDESGKVKDEYIYENGVCAKM